MTKKHYILPAIETLIEKLKEEKIFFTEEFEDELCAILRTNKAAISFADRITHFLPPFKENPTMMFNQKKIFERPTLSEDLKKLKIGKSSICCYKDTKNGKNNNNVRCIFIIEEDIICFLLAFEEKDKKAYRKALKEAIIRYNIIYEGE